MDELEETIRETTWNLCKAYDAQNKRREKIHLTNLVTIAIERLFGTATENNFRKEWQEEVDLFCQMYGYDKEGNKNA